MNSHSHPQDFIFLSEIINAGIPARAAVLGQKSETSTGYQTLSNPQLSQRAKLNGRKQAARVLQFLDLCVGCGADAEERHHKDGNPVNNARENIVPLCGGCHQLAHGKHPRRVERKHMTCSWAWRNTYRYEPPMLAEEAGEVLKNELKRQKRGCAV